MADKEKGGQDFTVRFERIGRSRDVAITLRGTDPSTEKGRDEIADGLYHQCRQYLQSAEFTVTVDFTSHEVKVDGGRFGQGMIQIDARTDA